MSRIKPWALLICGAACFLFGLLCAVNFAFDWDFVAPPSFLLGAVLVLGGGILFACGLIGRESPPAP